MTAQDYVDFLKEHYQLSDDADATLLAGVRKAIYKMRFQIKHIVTVSDKRYGEDDLDRIEKWCEENCNGKFAHLFSKVDWFFEDDTDAMLFKLTWR